MHPSLTQFHTQLAKLDRLFAAHPETSRYNLNLHPLWPDGEWPIVSFDGCDEQTVAWVYKTFGHDGWEYDEPDHHGWRDKAKAYQGILLRIWHADAVMPPLHPALDSANLLPAILAAKHSAKVTVTP